MQPIAILGAGLAGLSLADALLDAGLARPLVLIDRRERWDRDRTWCTWDTDRGPPLRFSGLASHRWWAWRISSPTRAVTARTARHPYLHIDARDLYDSVLERLAHDPRVELRPGEPVTAVRTGSAYPEVVTARETFTAESVVDALGPWSPLAAAVVRPAGSSSTLQQRFLGWEVELERPAFDPRTATLMDFRPPESGALTFLYELPFSTTRALVEHTTIGADGPSARRRRALLTAELDARVGSGGWRILHEERGVIPMDETPAPGTGHPRVVRAGAAAGAIRPSSGYAFTRTVRHAERLAAALIGKGPQPRGPGPVHLAALDRVFLSALRSRPDHGEGLFTAIAAGVGADAFARFMTDVSSPADELGLLTALPRVAMLRAAVTRFAPARSSRA